MANKKWVVFGILGIAVILFITGCGLLNLLNPSQTNLANPEIWIDQGVWSDSVLTPLAVD